MAAQQRVQLVRPPRSYSAARPATPPNKEVAGDPHSPPLPLRGRGEGVSPQAADKNLNEAITLASALSEDQRRELLATLSLELQVKQNSGQARDVQMWATAVHEALQEALGGSLGATVGPLAVQRIVGAHKAFEPVAEFMTRSRLREAQVVERLALYRLLAGLLVTYARKVAQFAGVPLSLKLVANNASHVAGLFDAAFPGYLGAGLAHIVARRLSVRKA